METKRCISSLTLEQLTAELKAMGQPGFRAKQLFHWVHQKLVTDFSAMTDQPKALLAKLEEAFYIAAPIIERRQEAKDGTVKYLLRMADGNCIETVVMRYHYGNTVCVSTQVGCRMGCRFCASTVGGLNRSLTTGEMLEQIYEVQRITGERVSNVILMGIGEPLDNYENVVRFIRMISDERGLHISQRNITLSTCGLVDGIYRLMKEDLTITLAISLHAPNDVLRREMMPVANRYSIAEILKACREYVDHTGRRVTFEYSLVDGTNDSAEHAEELAALLHGLNCHVNLIPLNPVEGRMGERSKRTKVLEFQKILESRHITATIRREMGSDIDAACGQLRGKNI